jgi:heterotetrameric sarcosine oxidase gamma subunit
MAYNADIRRVGAMTLFDLKGKQKALAGWAGEALPPFPSAPNTSASKDDIDLLFIGPDHWLLRAPLDREPELDIALKPTEAPQDISIVRVSDTQTFFTITGPEAEQIISVASPLDVHSSVFHENGATLTEAFGLKALIMRKSDGFWLAVEQSFGDMIEDYLNRAMS